MQRVVRPDYVSWECETNRIAAYMAEAYGRLSRRVGVCAISSGVAHANAMTGVVNAYLDGAPMLLITGSSSMQTMGLGHFQDLDQVALAAPVSKYARIVDRADRNPSADPRSVCLCTGWSAGCCPSHDSFWMSRWRRSNPKKVIRTIKSPWGRALSGCGDQQLVQRAGEPR